ncbi:MAG: ABC transporter ATP-binding protein [Candidatus Saccharimonas sp.]|nr:ABC transporter ATP-binding protein [Planctomycetaceae bacterium]
MIETSTGSSSSPLVELNGLSHFYGRFQALKDVSLTVAPGAIGLVGQNGAGKSTLLKLLLGLMRPTSGGGSVLGCDLVREQHLLRGRLGFMPEAESLVPGVRGVDLVALAGELSGMPRRQALRRAHEVLSYLELDEARYRRCEEYSVGMKQRLKLAAALVHDPQLLLLDEPTAGLDPHGRDAMLRLLHAIASRHGKSLILSTHLLGDIDRVCEQVIIVDRGSILGVGRIGELRQHWRDRYRLRWRGAGVGFVTALREAGVSVAETTRHDEALVDVPAEWHNGRFFELSVQHNITLCDVVPEEEDLPQLYHRLINGNSEAIVSAASNVGRAP